MLETLDQKTEITNEPLALLSGLSYSLTTDKLHYFGIKGVKYIASVEAKEVLKDIHNLTSIDDLSDYIECKTDIPSSFFEALNLLHMLRGPKILNYFEQEGLKRLEHECDGEYCCRIYKEDRSLFVKLSKRIEGKVKSDGTSFSVSSLMRPALKEKNFFVEKILELEEQCKEYFKRQGYTDHCILKLINVDGREGIRVERGSNLSHLPVLEGKKRLTRSTVLRKVDTIFFDDETQTIWIYAKGQKHQDIAFYKMIVAKVLTGYSECHSDLDFDLSFLKRMDLKSLLDKERAFAQRVILRKAFFPLQVDSCISSPLKTSLKRKECLTDKSDFRYNADKIFSFSGAELKVVVNEEEGIFDNITLSSGRITHGGLTSLKNIFDLLYEFEVLQKVYSNA